MGILKKPYDIYPKLTTQDCRGSPLELLMLAWKPCLAALIKRPSALIKRPLRLAGLDKVAIRFASPGKNGLAWLLINSSYATK